MRQIYKMYLFTICSFLFFSTEIYSADKAVFQDPQFIKISQLYLESDSLFNLYEFESANEQYQQNIYSLVNEYSCHSKEVVFAMYKIALCEIELGNYCKADSIISDALFMQNSIDSTSLMAGRLWYKKSELGNLLCDCKEVIPMAEKAVLLLERHLGKNHPEVAYALEILGYVLAHNYKYDESVDVLNRSLKILEDNFGTKSPKISRSLCYLSRVYLIHYDAEQGMPYLKRALSLRLTSDIDSMRRVSEINFFKTFILYVMSDYENAQEAALIAVENATKVYGEFHPNTGNYCSILSRVYLKLGKYEIAEPLMLKIKSIFEKTYRFNYPVMYYSYINLGELYISQGRYDEAKFYFTQVLDFEGIKKSSRIGILSNLAEIYFELGEFEKSEKLSKEVIAFRKNQLGENSPVVALSLKLLAKVYHKQNKFTTAEKTYLKILDIFEKNYGKNSLYTASALFDLAQLYRTFHIYNKAEKCLVKTISIRKSKLLSDHPLVANSILQLAEIQLKQNNTKASLSNMIIGLQGRREFIHRVFRYSSSEQKLLYTKLHPLIYDPLLILALKNNSEQTIQAASEMILMGKALVIDALSVDKAVSVCEEDQGISLLVDKYIDLCTQISALALSSKYNKINDLGDEKLEVLYKTRDSLEAELSMNCSAFGFSNELPTVTVKDIAKRLTENSLFIDIVKFKPNLDDDVNEHYLAYALNHKAEVKFIDIGKADVIDRLVLQIRENLQESQFKIYSQHSAFMEDKLQNKSHELFNLLLKPFSNEVNGKHKLFIAPDSDLNLIPFEILVDDQTNYLIENFEINYLSSGRDFIADDLIDNEANGLIVIAAPDYDKKNQTQLFIQTSKTDKIFDSQFLPIRSQSTTANCLTYSFSPLSYSRKEGQHLIDLFQEKRKSESAKLYFNKDATTTVLLELKTAPQYLHISTHGFFCVDDEEFYNRNPLLRSGLVFTGVNNRIANNAEAPFSYDDGILTALEVTGLNLVGTELVTLSACETGIGETVSGEGVFGLRRAFQIAGAKSILMSMWKIPDKETSQLMIKFYDKLFSGMSKQKSLRESALEILNHSRKTYHHGHPYMWGGFILTGIPN